MHKVNSLHKKSLAITVYTTTQRDVERYQQEIAARVGVSPSTIGAWLQHRRKLPKAQEERIFQEAAEIECEQSG